MEKLPNPQPINRFADNQIPSFAHHLYNWLMTALDTAADEDFQLSRAKAMLRAASVVDKPLLADFERLMGDNTAVRVALADLLETTGLKQETAVTQWPGLPAAELEDGPPWLTLIVAAFAWKNGYPLAHLDPAAPPAPYSPAGQVLQRTGHFIRRQAQRTATERSQLARHLAYRPDTAVPRLNQMSADDAIAPTPPHFRAPIPVRYPEVARETVRVTPDEPTGPVTAVPRTDPITITPDDIPPAPPTPTRMPPIRIERNQAPPTHPARPPVIQPGTAASFGHAVRRKFSRSQERLVTAKLRVVAQEYPDGPGLAGLQVKVRCQGIRSFVAGATNQDGRFLCQLPVRARSGLTYDVEITWPRDFGGDAETKSITLNADRTEFTLPFYRRLNL